MEHPILKPGGGEKETFIVCRNSQGAPVRASTLRLSRHLVAFEVYNPYSILQLSEVLSDFRIVMDDRVVYSGRAVVSSLVNTGIALVCETSLEDSWLDVSLFSPVNQRDKLRSKFAELVEDWEKTHRVFPDFKVVVADMQTLLMDLRRWLEQVELGVRSQPSGDRAQIEREVIHELEEPILPTVAPLLQRFEKIAGKIDSELQAAHRSYIKRQIHPLVLCAPFIYRSFQKPLGYAGDYEMVNMMLRDPYEGGSLFAKMLNKVFLETPPVVAHRNRITYLTQALRVEIARQAAAGRRARIYNLGCGPAQEIQRLLAETDVADHADFTLLDFNEETLAFTGSRLEELKQRHHRAASFRLVKQSVNQILKDASKASMEFPPGSFDLVYCAGLFDYLSDRICRRLMSIFYDLLAPGALLVATNVDSSNPSRGWMEYVLEWHLVYRNRRQLEWLAPEQAPPETFSVKSDISGVNIFIEVRKPRHA